MCRYIMLLCRVFLSLSLSQHTFIRKYFLTRRTLKNIALCYIWVHSSAIRPVPAFGTVWNYEPSAGNRTSSTAGLFLWVAETRAIQGRGFRATTQQHYAAPSTSLRISTLRNTHSAATYEFLRRFICVQFSRGRCIAKWTRTHELYRRDKCS